MPTLKKIVVQDFRNIAFQELSFSPNVNCISGNNGEGKTNLLDAVYYLSMTKSAFPTPDRYNWRFGTEGFTIGGTYLMDNGLESRFSIRVAEGEKKLVRDDKPCTRISEHIGLLPVVMVSPGDIALVSESGEERRRFVNGVLSQMDRSYLAAIQTYNRLLAQRNKMLKDGNVDWDLMAVFDARMAAAAQPVFEARKRLAALFLLFTELLLSSFDDVLARLLLGSASLVALGRDTLARTGMSAGLTAFTTAHRVVNPEKRA